MKISLKIKTEIYSQMSHSLNKIMRWNHDGQLLYLSVVNSEGCGIV